MLLDQWQRVPDVWDAVKRAVDADGTGGRFLLTGSPPAKGTVTHSGAGRIVLLRMRPMTLPERGVKSPTVSLATLLDGEEPPVQGTCGLDLGDYTDLTLRRACPACSVFPTGVAYPTGRLPGPHRRPRPRGGGAQRAATRDRSWLDACLRGSTSTTATWKTFRDAATSGSGDKPAKTTTIPYIETLSALRILDQVPAWQPGHNHLFGSPRAPSPIWPTPRWRPSRRRWPRLPARRRSWRGDHPPGRHVSRRPLRVAGHVYRPRVRAGRRREVFHLRTYEGRHEVDLIVEGDNGKVLALEVKLSAAIDDDDTRHLRWLANEIGDQLVGAAVLTTGKQAYRRPSDGVAVIPPGLLGP